MATIIDLGTGDGRFVYKNAIKNPQNHYIGIDPSEKQLQSYIKKSNRKKLKNAKFITASAEQLPENLKNIADKVYINLPWRSLLMHIVNSTPEIIENVSNLLKVGGELEIILGYKPEFEPSETERLDLPDINQNLIENIVAPNFLTYGNLELKAANKLTNEQLKNIETTWAKKLGHGKGRPLYKMVFTKLL